MQDTCRSGAGSVVKGRRLGCCEVRSLVGLLTGTDADRGTRRIACGHPRCRAAARRTVSVRGDPGGVPHRARPLRLVQGRGAGRGEATRAWGGCPAAVRGRPTLRHAVPVLQRSAPGGYRQRSGRRTVSDLQEGRSRPQSSGTTVQPIPRCTGSPGDARAWDTSADFALATPSGTDPDDKGKSGPRWHLRRLPTRRTANNRLHARRCRRTARPLQEHLHQVACRCCHRQDGFMPHPKLTWPGLGDFWVPRAPDPADDHGGRWDRWAERLDRDEPR